MALDRHTRMAHGTTLTLTVSHPDYPLEARAMAKPPPCLYVRGTLPQGKRLAIVGTRRPTLQALAFARRLARHACEAGWSVWSGGAAGIDSEAHLGALDVNGKTVVVMGTGFDHPYPQHNSELFDRVLAQGGAWLSPYSCDQVGARWTFLPRNELLAAMVEHIVIVQAPVRSGARSTVAAGRRMNKTLWAVPGAPWDVESSGCLQEILAGARLLHDPEQLVGPAYTHAYSTPRPKRRHGSHEMTATSRRASVTPLDPFETAILQVLRTGPASFDTLCERTRLSASQTSGALLTLSLKGIVTEDFDTLFRLT